MTKKQINKYYPNGFVHGIIAGHGGVKDGKYQILEKGSKQHKFEDGLTIYEGEQNRIIKDTTIGIARWEGIEVIDLVPGTEDVPIGMRIDIVNMLNEKYKSEGKMLLLWEIHLNAFSNSKTEGKEIFTTRGQNFADHMATVLWNNMEEVIPEQKDRPDWSDGDPDKEKDFNLIKGSRPFGVLAELFFFTNRKEVDLYCNSEGYMKWAWTFVKTFKQLNKEFYG